MALLEPFNLAWAPGLGNDLQGSVNDSLVTAALLQAPSAHRPHGLCFQCTDFPTCSSWFKDPAGITVTHCADLAGWLKHHNYISSHGQVWNLQDTALGFACVKTTS